MAVLHQVGMALLRPDVPCPELTAVLDAGVAAVFQHLRSCLELEIGKPPPYRPTWRRWIAGACRECGVPGIPKLSSVDAGAWDSCIQGLEDRILWDADYDIGDNFMDGPPEVDEAMKQMFGVSDDYFTAIPPDPRPEEVPRLREELMALCRGICRPRPALRSSARPPESNGDERRALRVKGQAEVASTTPLYHLEVMLSHVKPPVWRHLQVPGNANLGWLHAVIQVAVGWTNSHLHQFLAGERVFSDPAFELDDFEGSRPVVDEQKVTLMQVAPRQGDELSYEYDFGDSWAHRIVVVKVLEPDPAADRVAYCLDGARACPPEDCGGARAYADLLKIIRNPEHKEHKAMLEWLGRPFDPEAFDLDKINTFLRQLKWPHITERQLGAVLMRRDGAGA
jgi:hypothetical protein